jgi:hypothetical protein
MVEVSSAGDDRTANNSDAVRHNYRVLSDAEKAAMTAIKDLGAELLELINGVAEENPNAGRACALARTKTEEAVMWAVKGLTG